MKSIYKEYHSYLEFKKNKQYEKLKISFLKLQNNVHIKALCYGIAEVEDANILDKIYLHSVRINSRIFRTIFVRGSRKQDGYDYLYEGEEFDVDKKF